MTISFASPPRTYTDAEGTSVPVTALLEQIRGDAQSFQKNTVPPDPAAGGSADTPHTREVRYVRGALASIAASADLIDALDTLLEVLDPRGKDPKTGAKGLTGLIGSSGPDAPLVHRAEMPDPPFTARAVRAELQEMAAALQEARSPLQPPSLAAAHGLRDDALDVEEILNRLETRVIPVLGGVESALLRQAVRHLRTQLATWTEAHTSVHILWQELREERDTTVDAADDLLDWILDRPADPVRHHLVVLLARTLMEPPAADGPRTWDAEEALLRWAATPSRLDRLTNAERETWLDAVTTLWTALEQQAMDDGYEARVLRLSTDERLAPVRARRSTASLLDAVRRWCLDRYNLTATARLTSVLRDHPATSQVTGTATAFLAHFSRVWVALLLGAILMLDFGGAWTAMAAEGDVGGVAVTFTVGVVGTLGYLLVDLRGKVRRAPNEPAWTAHRSRWVRVLLFLGVCLLVTVAFTTGLWLLLADTGEVVRGAGAALHIVVWTGFALFVGVFFGLLAESG